MAIFGNTNVEAIAKNIDGGLRGTAFTCPEDGVADSIYVYLTDWDSGTDVQCAIYKKSDSSLVKTTEIRNSGGSGWEKFDFTDPKPSLEEGVEYVLCGKGEVFEPHKDTSMRSGNYSVYRYYKYLESAPYPNPFDGTQGTANYRYSIYCDYTPSGATYTKTWTIDGLFKKLGIPKSLGVDTAFQKQDIPKTFGLDAAFQKSFSIQKQIDALFKRLDILKTFGVDADFLKRDIIKSFAVDACFGGLMTQTISRQIDVLLKKLDLTKNFGLDVYFGPFEAETYTKNFALDTIFAYKVRMPELWLDENGKIVLNISKPYTWVGS
jgi:hypothetical protein